METKTINLDKADHKSIIKLLNEGWKLIFFGDLKATKHSDETNNIILFTKYKTIKKKVKKNPKKTKIKRNPG